MNLLSVVIFFFAIIIHEYAHGWVANKLGDPTAKYSGRLTLNPLAHIDIIGTIILPLFLILTGNPVFGWAKPVPINYWNLKNPRKDMIWVGLAGPVANILLAVLANVILRNFTNLTMGIFSLLKIIILYNVFYCLRKFINQQYNFFIIQI